MPHRWETPHTISGLGRFDQQRPGHHLDAVCQPGTGARLVHSELHQLEPGGDRRRQVRGQGLLWPIHFVLSAEHTCWCEIRGRWLPGNTE